MVKLPIADSMTNLEQSSAISEFPVRYDTITYRGQEINFLSDPAGVRCAGQWGDCIVELGLNNIYYKEDMCKFVDRKLDLITTFPKSPELQGAKLEWFRNGDFRDIRLSYRGRVLKVFLVRSSTLVDIDQLIMESESLLYKSGLLEEN